MHLTRLDFAVGSAGLMRQVLTRAFSHTQTRRGFGSAFADRPMMTSILADLAIDAEACTLLAFMAARQPMRSRGVSRRAPSPASPRRRSPSSGTASERRLDVEHWSFCVARGVAVFARKQGALLDCARPLVTLADFLQESGKIGSGDV
jgi:alkylation response protein AidB-like acyl-CoA dehydrogenase